MEQPINSLKELIDSSKVILITSHIGPDGDSVCSSLLLFQTLQLNYPDKKIIVSMEEENSSFDFLNGFNDIKIKPLPTALSDSSPDLLIILDANTVSRISRQPADARRLIAESGLKIAIIDHHEPENVEPNEVYINNFSPAVTLDIYELCFETYKFRQPTDYAQTAITGIYTDTGGFINRNLNFQKTFEVVPKLIAKGADLELISNKLSRITKSGFKVLREFLNNTQFAEGYTYSFLSDETAANKANIEAIRQGADIFRSDVLRNVDNNQWGFIVYKDALAAPNIYSVSFRALGGVKDVSKLATKLGGGGHKPAAGAKFEASDITTAVQIVKHIIET